MESCGALIGRRPLLAALIGLAGCAGPAKITLRLASRGDELAFAPDRLACGAGDRVTVIFHHDGRIVHDPHDWVLLKPGTMKKFLAVADAAPEGSDGVTAANAAMVLARTPPCSLGHTVQVTFTAPAAGDYDFACSIPVHGETMHGILTIS